MEFINPRDINSSQKIRRSEHIISQIEADYQILNQLWTGIENGITDVAQTEPLLQRMAWIQAGLAAMDQDQEGGIEGVHTGRLGQIERGVQTIHEKIQCLQKKV